jgi:hypothetical protein
MVNYFSLLELLPRVFHNALATSDDILVGDYTPCPPFEY